MDPDTLLPFAYEGIWYSLGALFMFIEPALAVGFFGIVILGGLFGSIARNYTGGGGMGE